MAKLNSQIDFPKTKMLGGKEYKLSSVHRFKRIAKLKQTKLHHDMYRSVWIVHIGNKYGVYYRK